MKQVQDHYFKLAKKEGYPARSVYKLSEAQQKYRLLKMGDRVLDIGCQPGSWSMFAAKVVGPGGLIVGVDINDGQKIQVTRAAAIKIFCADIMSTEVTGLLQSAAPDFQVMISDLAPRTTGNRWADQQKSLTLSRRVLELAKDLLCQGGNFYCKVFEGEDFRDFYEEVKSQFAMAKIFKPKSSRSESREVYILAMGYSKRMGG